MSKVVVTLVTWNNIRHLPETLRSISRQTCGDLPLVVIDNASTDGTVEFIRKHYPHAMILRNTNNLGFSRAHNQGIAYASTHLNETGQELYVLVTNPDVILEPDYVERARAEMDRHPGAGSVGGKLLRVFEYGEGELKESMLSNRIDSTGMCLYKSRKFVERGAGEEDSSRQKDRTEDVFGVTGALAMYRLKALQDVAYRGEYFDEDFFAYKEDVDLAWRLRLRGWRALYVPEAVAYHYRTAHSPDKPTLREIVANRRTRSRMVKRLSYSNHLLVLVKNEHLSNFLIDLPRITLQELRKALFILFFEPKTLAAWGRFFRLLPRALSKRQVSMERAEAQARDIRRWLT